MKRITLVAGARPNFMKIAPLIRALSKRPQHCTWRLVHTGQHYDHEMNDVFFDELGIPRPNAFLGCGGGSHGEQTAKVMMAFEKDCLDHPTDTVVVVGDINSTLACAIVAKKLQIQVAHVEAGLRSGDRTMPEEINRLATDAITDLFFVTEPSGYSHLIREGQPQQAIHMVGHVMIDNLLYQVEQLKQMPASRALSDAAKLKKGLQRSGPYAVATLHRPSNVDNPLILRDLLSTFAEIANRCPIIFPIHPRTRSVLERENISLPEGVHPLPPQSYMDFLSLWMDASFVLTDSGGLQEETTGLGVPCLTLRENTERPITIDEGTNILTGTSSAAILEAANAAIAGQGKKGRRPDLWDGCAAERIADILLRA